MGLKPEFQQTELGRIPADWDVKSLGELGDALIGLTYAPADVATDGILVLRSSNVQDGVLKFDDNVFVRKSVPERIMVRLGDILICVRNGSRELIGKSALIDERAQGMTFGAFMAVFRTPFSGFIYHQFTSDLLKKQIHEHLGATINQITNKSLNSFRIPFPRDEVERERISSALSDVDALVDWIERLVAKKRNLKRAAIQQLLTNRIPLPGFDGKWEMKRVDEMGEVLAGKALDVQGAGKLRPYLRTKNVLDGRIDIEDVLEMPMTDAEFERFRVMKDDVLLNEGQSLELVGRCSMYRDELSALCAMQNQLLRFRARKHTSPAFAEHLFRHCQHTGVFSAIATQTTSVAHLGSTRFSSLRLLWPSDPAEQNEIATVLSDMDGEIAALEQRREKIRLLKQGMMQELLMGRTRLI
jgi:type I restriction enzyme S subunit